MLDDQQLQELTTGACGIFQLYFYKHLFDPVSDSKIIDNEFLTKKTATLLNENFSTNEETNEEEMNLLAKDNNL